MRILSNFLCFCRTEIVSRWYHNNFDTSLISGMHILKVIWWYHFHPFIYSITELLFHGSTWSDPFCQGHCVYFTTLAAVIHYNKRSVVYLRKTIVALWICNHLISWHFFKKIKKMDFIGIPLQTVKHMYRK